MAGPCSPVVPLQRQVFALSQHLFSFPGALRLHTCAGTCASQLDLYSWDQDHQSQVLVSTKCECLVQRDQPPADWQDTRATTAPLMV